MPWLRVDTSKESYLLSEMPPLCGVRRPPREVNGTPTPGTIPVGNTHDHRLERQCDVPIPMEAFKTRDRRLLRRESSLEVDKQVEAQQWPECRRRTRLVASSRAATCRRPQILCLELGLLGAPRRRPVDVVLRISTNRSWRPLLKFGCLNSHFGCAYVSRNRFGGVLMEEKYCRDASTRASCAAPSLSHGRSLRFGTAALEGRPVPLGADAVPSPESVGSRLRGRRGRGGACSRSSDEALGGI